MSITAYFLWRSERKSTCLVKKNGLARPFENTKIFKHNIYKIVRCCRQMHGLIQSYGIRLCHEMTFFISPKMDNYSLKFTVTAYNGGFVNYKDMENHNTIGRYNIKGQSESVSYSLGFDDQSPRQCYEMSSVCTDQPLVTPDFLDQVRVILYSVAL